MLSEHERRRLTSIERQLWRDDPGLARRLAGWPSSLRARWATAAAITVIGLCGIGVLLGLLSLNAGLLLGCGVPVLVASIWLSRRARRSRPSDEREPGEEPEELAGRG